MKKLIVIMLCLAFVLSYAAVFSTAEGALPHIAYTDSGRCGDDMFFELDRETGVLTITKNGDGDGKMYFPEDGTITIHMWEPWLVKKMILPEGMTTLIIPEGSKFITEIEFPSTLEQIVPDSFWPENYLESLTSLKIPKNLRSISKLVLATLQSVKTVEVDPENDYFTYDGHALYSKDMKTLYHVFVPTDVFEVPSSVTAVEKYAFKHNRTIKRLILPVGVRVIAEGMFSNYEQLESVVMKGAQYIDSGAFSGCYELKYVEIPDSIIEMKGRPFKDCKKLTSIVIPKTIKKLEKVSFISFGETDKRVVYLKDILFRGTANEWISVVSDAGSDQKDKEAFESISIHYNWNLDDVKAGEWYVHGVAECVDKGIMVGTGNGVFSPDMTLTRAQIVQILAKALDVDLDAYTPSGSFKDVTADAWYAKAVEWAVENDITRGTGDGCFSPDDPVSREQLVTFLYAAFGNDEPAAVNLSDYSDAQEISDWADIPIRWALRFNIISGTSNTTLSPKSSATRAQTALIVNKCIEKGK